MLRAAEDREPQRAEGTARSPPRVQHRGQADRAAAGTWENSPQLCRPAAAAIGVEEIRLYTNLHMARNVALYRRHGYVEIGRARMRAAPRHGPLGGAGRALRPSG